MSRSDIFGLHCVVEGVITKRRSITHSERFTRDASYKNKKRILLFFFFLLQANRLPHFLCHWWSSTQLELSWRDVVCEETFWPHSYEHFYIVPERTDSQNLAQGTSLTFTAHCFTFLFLTYIKLLVYTAMHTMQMHIDVKRLNQIKFYIGRRKKKLIRRSRGSTLTLKLLQYARIQKENVFCVVA